MGFRSSSWCRRRAGPVTSQSRPGLSPGCLPPAGWDGRGQRPDSGAPFPCACGVAWCRLRTPSEGCAVTEVDFRLLGAMQLRVDDEPAKLPGAAERGLLALLLLSPGRTFAGEGWATVEAARLDQLHQAALTERAEAALAMGRHVEVVADLEPTVAKDP